MKSATTIIADYSTTGMRHNTTHTVSSGTDFVHDLFTILL